MWAYGQSYEEHIRPYVPLLSRDPEIPFFSSVTGQRLAGVGTLGPGYWRSNMESPVLFNSALRSALKNENSDTVLIEIGPHPALRGPIRQILSDLGRTDVHIGTLSRDEKCQESILHLAGKLYLENVAMNYSAVCPPGNFLKNLPQYAWKQSTSYWEESRIAHEWRFRSHPPHELLGSRVIDNGAEPCWRNNLKLDHVPWLKGHEVDGKIVFPGAAYIGMVGEALRQLTGQTTFSVRNVRITSARVLEDGQATEFLTGFKPILIDTSEKSPWYSFTISTFDGCQWTRNCSGDARPDMDKSITFQPHSSSHVAFPRKVDETAWFNGLSRIGLSLSGKFTGIESISASPVEHKAAATVPAQESPASRGTQYALHPCVIDKCFQVLGVAAGRGLSRNMVTLAVPTFIEEMTISPCAADLKVIANVDAIERGSYVGNISGEHNGSTSLHIKGYKSSTLSTEDQTIDDRIITQSEWNPSSDFTDLNKYLHSRQETPESWPLLEELMILCIIDHQERLEIVDATPRHYINFMDWMKVQIERYCSGRNVFVSKDVHLESLSSAQRLARIDEIVTNMPTSRWSILSTAIYRLFSAAPAIFAGETHPLSILREDDVLSQVYTTGDTLDFAGALQVIANTNPLLKVLEIGAGTGGTTAKVLQALKSSYGERLYSSYTFTDITSGFMAAASERFADFQGINYSVLDISRDPVEQGYELGSYDLIVCSNVSLRPTPTILKCKPHLTKLLSKIGSPCHSMSTRKSPAYT